MGGDGRKDKIIIREWEVQLLFAHSYGSVFFIYITQTKTMVIYTESCTRTASILKYIYVCGENGKGGEGIPDNVWQY